MCIFVNKKYYENISFYHCCYPSLSMEKNGLFLEDNLCFYSYISDFQY